MRFLLWLPFLVHDLLRRFGIQEGVVEDVLILINQLLDRAFFRISGLSGLLFLQSVTIFIFKQVRWWDPTNFSVVCARLLRRAGRLL